MEMVRLSALSTSRLYPPGMLLVHSPVRNHSATGKIKSTKNVSFPACSAVLQPTAPPRAPPQTNSSSFFKRASVFHLGFAREKS